MTVNDGVSTGSIAAGTPFSGSFYFDQTPTSAATAFGGGTHTVYGFSTMDLTIGGTTVSWGPGKIDVYDNLTSTSSGYPTGDSVYVNINGVAPNGPINGAQFNFIFLGLVDGSGKSIANGALVDNLSMANFNSAFIEFNYGTKGTKWGAGNTSTLQFLTPATGLTGSGGSNPPPTVCSGTNAVETAYVARNPGFIVVNGGLNLLDHLWTTNLNASNTTFLGGLVNWYQTGLILSYTGTTDPSGCILDHLTVAPGVTITTTSLPSATVGVAYQAPVSVAWGVAPYAVTVSGLPAGLSFDGSKIAGTPAAAGTFQVTVQAVDNVGAKATSLLALSVATGGNYTVPDEGKGKITAIDPNFTYVMAGKTKLLVDSSSNIVVNTPDGERHVIDSFVQVGMKVQWKGLRDRATDRVLVNRIEIN